MPLLFEPLAMMPFVLAFMAASLHFLFMSLMFPPLATTHFFLSALQALLFEPLAMAPFAFAFLVMTPESLNAPLIFLATPICQFAFLLFPAALPLSLKLQALIIRLILRAMSIGLSEVARTLLSAWPFS
jgi:membrane-anchored protein YejM (alkaline phosphatase superfamily)